MNESKYITLGNLISSSLVIDIAIACGSYTVATFDWAMHIG